MPPRKKNSKPKKVTKKSVKKKSVKKAVKKTAKKAAIPKPPSFVPPDEVELVDGARTCIKRGNRWFCMKQDGNGHMVVCDGPFASKEDCEENAVCP